MTQKLELVSKRLCVTCKHYYLNELFDGTEPKHQCIYLKSPVTGNVVKTNCEFERAGGHCLRDGIHWEAKNG